MPHQEISIEDVLCKTKDRKSSKKCSKKCSKKSPVTPCNVECCVPDCNPECCTAAFQRLDKLRMEWLLVQNGLTIMQQTSSSAVPPNTSYVYNRAAEQVLVPTSLLPLEQTAFGFVNTVRYLNYEECGKLDQVTGWSIDIATGDLHFYQNLPDLGLSIADSRYALLTTAPSGLTPADRHKLVEMEPFWKLSIKAVYSVRQNPKTEGNICEIRDKCGNKYLVAINRSNSQPNGQSVCNYNSQFSIVAVKLC